MNDVYDLSPTEEQIDKLFEQLAVELGALTRSLALIKPPTDVAPVRRIGRSVTRLRREFAERKRA